MSVTVVIPTCNRQESLARLLNSLLHSTQFIFQVIVVDSGDHDLRIMFTKWPTLNILYLRSERSVCVQRNIGIQNAQTDWVFLCDDDIEVPKEYLPGIIGFVSSHHSAGAVSGIVLQQENEIWKPDYPLASQTGLLLNKIFGLGVWGEVRVTGKLANHIIRSGNRVTRSGWPVVINLSGAVVHTPVYGLGAAVVKKEWLLNSPYDETLDPSGIGDNYGVAMGFPSDIVVLTELQVFHHRSEVNRMDEATSYYRRLLALGYFILTGKKKPHVSRWLYSWSLIGNLLIMAKRGEMKKLNATWKAFVFSLLGNNPYLLGRKKKLKRVTPSL